MTLLLHNYTPQLPLCHAAFQGHMVYDEIKLQLAGLVKR